MSRPDDGVAQALPKGYEKHHIDAGRSQSRLERSIGDVVH
jgi:hypothetical protein